MRLLVLKCSSLKRTDSSLLPAIERYNGPLWQVLRSYLREQPLGAISLEVYGLSAEFGLIPGTQLIPVYDRTMAPDRADELRPQVLEQFQALLQRQHFSQLCLGLSHRYLQVLPGWERYVPTGVQVTLTDGPVGTKLGQLHAWLRGEVWAPAADQPDRLKAPAQPRGRATLKGTTIALSRDEVFDTARRALAADGGKANHFRNWYVLLDGRHVSAKWLVSQISGLPTSEFDAAAARRLLLALGVDVERAHKAQTS